jgi:hypothetical protein
MLSLREIQLEQEKATRRTSGTRLSMSFDGSMGATTGILTVESQSLVGLVIGKKYTNVAQLATTAGIRLTSLTYCNERCGFVLRNCSSQQMQQFQKSVENFLREYLGEPLRKPKAAKKKPDAPQQGFHLLSSMLDDDDEDMDENENENETDEDEDEDEEMMVMVATEVFPIRYRGDIACRKWWKQKGAEDNSSEEDDEETLTLQEFEERTGRSTTATRKKTTTPSRAESPTKYTVLSNKRSNMEEFTF